MQLAKTTIPPPQLSLAFIEKAERIDAKIIALVASAEKTFSRLGTLFLQVKEEGLHVALGFNSFPDYLATRVPEHGNSKTQIYEAMRVTRELTSGATPAATKRDIDEMPQASAIGLARMKKEGVKITPKLIEKAKTMPAPKFKAQIVLPAVPSLAQKEAVKNGATIAGGAEIDILLKYKVKPETAAMMNRASLMFARVGGDDDKETAYVDRFLQALCAEFESANGAEFERILLAEQEAGIHAAVTSDAAMGPEPDEEEEE